MRASCSSAPSAALSAQQPAPAADSQQWDEDPGWPRVLEKGDVTLTVYLPQVEKFEGDTLEARAAVQVETKVEGEEKPRTTYGVIWIQARTQIDKEAGLVFLDEIAIPRASFPGDPGRTEDYLNIIRGQAESQRTISLARIQANLAIIQAEAKGNAVPLKNDPPRVIYSTTPVLLVLVDGDAVLRPVEGSGLKRIVNTRALILSDGSRYFMPIMNRWVQAASLDAKWSFATPPPAAEAIRKSIADDENQAQADLLTDPSDDVKALVEKGALPRIVVSTSPAELLVTSGQPQMSPIAGTHLLYVKNSETDIFLDTQNQSYYVPLSGRWYRAASLNGPWEFVDGKQLPADFAKIPLNNPKSEVLATVPGTPQAQEAVIANSIPQTAEVKRDAAKLEAKYDGQPQFQPVPDTPLQYAVNSPTPVIRVDARSYYAVQEGVWFVGGSPAGPWAVATSVPTVIYTIPTASPIHYVTYVRIYRYTPTVVYVGYTPGYMGTCYSPWGTVVYGTGWYYRPWVGSVWLGYPWTYGFGVHLGWNSWSGWNFGFGWGGYRPPWRPWWGPYGYGWGRPPRPPGYWGRPPVYPGRPRPVPYNFNHYNVYNNQPGVVRPVVRPAPRPAVQPVPGTRPAVQPPSSRPAVQPAGPSTRPAVQPARPETRPAPQPGGPSTRPAVQPAQPQTRPAVQPARPARRRAAGRLDEGRRLRRQGRQRLSPGAGRKLAAIHGQGLEAGSALGRLGVEPLDAPGAAAADPAGDPAGAADAAGGVPGEPVARTAGAGDGKLPGAAAASGETPVAAAPAVAAGSEAEPAAAEPSVDSCRGTRLGKKRRGPRRRKRTGAGGALLGGRQPCGRGPRGAASRLEAFPRPDRGAARDGAQPGAPAGARSGARGADRAAGGARAPLIASSRRARGLTEHDPLESAPWKLRSTSASSRRSRARSSRSPSTTTTPAGPRTRSPSPPTARRSGGCASATASSSTSRAWTSRANSSACRSRFPVILAPTALHRLAHPEGEKLTARAAASAGTLMTLSTVSSVPLEEVAAAAPGGARWFQLYCYDDRADTERLVARAHRAGYRAIVLTVDAPILGRRERDVRNGFEVPAGLTAHPATRPRATGGQWPLSSVIGQPGLSWKDLAWIRALSPLPLVLKGIVRGDDAARAVDEGSRGGLGLQPRRPPARHGDPDGRCARRTSWPPWPAGRRSSSTAGSGAGRTS